jgi:Fe-S oxidoreductase
LNEKLFDIDRRREPPKWAGQTLERWFARRRNPAPQNPDVVLFNDTFTNFYSPEIGIAAIEVLETAGLRVALKRGQCCGRPLISKGLLKEARELAGANAKFFSEQAEASTPMVFLEPSCLSAVREDAPDLLRGALRDKAYAIGETCFLFEDFLQKQCSTGRVQLNLREGPSQILLHGHCHQKSMGLLQPAKALLGRVPRAKVVDLDAGCCGMAGSFGYSREHFEVSRKIGERRLLPAARSLKEGEVLVAAGVSCRQQVEDFAGKQAVHPAVLLRSLLNNF